MSDNVYGRRVTIRARNVYEVRAQDVQPGMITTDGIVLSVRTVAGETWIEHRNTSYAEPARKMVQIYGAIEDSMVRTLLEQLVADGELEPARS